MVYELFEVTCASHVWTLLYNGPWGATLPCGCYLVYKFRTVWWLVIVCPSSLFHNFVCRYSHGLCYYQSCRTIFNHERAAVPRSSSVFFLRVWARGEIEGEFPLTGPARGDFHLQWGPHSNSRGEIWPAKNPGGSGETLGESNATDTRFGKLAGARDGLWVLRKRSQT